ncbi:hypothetical protein CKO28_14605 [Rhodovibrio sodomensis]|uniref:UrcA family protein n=1 Tax=Rhodovibrio sodomensis TaxID=1088 RepID=A0ABS1DFM9_9PROT|nr:hypothetical protein [Rhodovibrio sodomensis]MBK1669265.1 hypothetical protein [Rhodovibrio sodomensis]
MKMLICACVAAFVSVAPAHASDEPDPIYNTKVMHVMEDMGLLSSALKTCGARDKARSIERMAEEVIAVLTKNAALMAFSLRMELADGLADGALEPRPCSWARIEKLKLRVETAFKELWDWEL